MTDLAATPHLSAEDRVGCALVVVVQYKSGDARLHRFSQASITVGRKADNDVVLPKGNVSKRHVRFELREGEVFVVDLKSTCGFYVNGQRLGGVAQVRPTDRIYIGDFVLSAAAGLPAPTDAASDQD